MNHGKNEAAAHWIAGQLVGGALVELCPPRWLKEVSPLVVESDGFFHGRLERYVRSSPMLVVTLADGREAWYVTSSEEQARQLYERALAIVDDYTKRTLL